MRCSSRLLSGAPELHAPDRHCVRRLTAALPPLKMQVVKRFTISTAFQLLVGREHYRLVATGLRLSQMKAHMPMPTYPTVRRGLVYLCCPPSCETPPT